MSWWRELSDYGVDMLNDLDQIGERIGEAFHEHVTPVVKDTVTWLDKALDGKGKQFEKSARSSALALDDRYQRFMVKRFDPLFGQTRTEQLEEMGSLQISPQEVILNRRIALSTGLFFAMLIGKAVFPASLIITVPLSFTIALPVYGMARKSVQQQRRVTYHVVSAINVTAIFLGGLYLPAIGATVFFYLGEKLLMITEDRSHKGLISVFSKQPRTVWVLRDGVEMESPFEEISQGDIVVVGAGGVMPVDGAVVEGLASIDQQMLTGEAQPAEKSPGDKVYASTVVLAGKIHVRVDKAGTETVAAKIGEILNKTASYQLALQSRGSKLAHDAAGPTLALAALALPLGPGSALGMLNSSFGVSVRVSAPITMLNLFNIASYNAILLKDGRSLELLSEVDTVLFDKTGTLTISQPNVANVHCAGRFDEAQILTFAAAAEHRQTHPIALAIVAEARDRGLSIPEIDDARYEVGYGIKVQVEQQNVQVGSDRFMRLSEIDLPLELEAVRAECDAKGHSLIMVAVGGVLVGAIELQPTIRPEAEAVVSALRKRGLKMVIISGDQEGPTRRLAERLGMDRYFANVLPEGKASLVEQLQSEGRSVCFVGDGINDSIALKKANVSVSLRGATTVATDSAQVVLMQESLQQLPYLFHLADEMDRSLRWGYYAGMIPGVINVAGVFFLGWGYYQGLALTMVSLAAGMGIAVYPTYKHKQELEQAEAMMSAGAGVPQLPPATAIVLA
jgi:Cu2+-exporting ATPase